jgi:hypothetical protein
LKAIAAKPIASVKSSRGATRSICVSSGRLKSHDEVTTVRFHLPWREFRAGWGDGTPPPSRTLRQGFWLR